jgi:hypothetical protein
MSWVQYSARAVQSQQYFRVFKKAVSRQTAGF